MVIVWPLTFCVTHSAVLSLHPPAVTHRDLLKINIYFSASLLPLVFPTLVFPAPACALMQTLSRKTTLRAKHVTHTSGKKDMITAGEGVQIKTLGFVEVFVSNVGPSGGGV